MRNRFWHIAIVALLGILSGLAVLELIAHRVFRVEKSDSCIFSSGADIRQDITRRYFIRKKHQGRWWYFHNRRPDTEFPVFLEQKPDDEIRIFIIGESAADILYGADQPAECPDNLRLTEILSRRFPGRKLNIIQAGFGGWKSWQILQVAREIREYDPDLILVLMGNNYVSVPLLDTARHRNPPPLLWLYKRSEVYFRLCEFIWQLRSIGRYDLQWFKRDFEEIIRIFADGDIDFVSFQLPVNYTDLPPDGYYKPDPDYIKTRILLERGLFDRAAEYIDSLERNCNPILLFLKGRALQGQGRYDEARGAYTDVLSHDTSIRASPEINQIIRDITAEYKGISVDLVTLFENISEKGLPGEKLFYDNCHWYGELNTLIFKTLAIELNRRNIRNIPPVSRETLYNIGTLQDYLPNHREGYLRRDWGVAIGNALAGFSELSVFQMSRKNVYHVSLAQGISRISSKDTIRAYLEAWNVEYDRPVPVKVFHRVLAAAGEAARIHGDLEVATLILNTAVNMSEVSAADGYVCRSEVATSLIFRGFLRMSVRAYDKGVADFERAAKIRGKTISRERMLNFLKTLEQP